MLRIAQITKKFEANGTTVEALRGLDLTVKRGSIVAVMGPNGSGKSTLFRILDGQLEPTSGEIVWDEARKGGRASVAHVPQETRTLNFPEMLVEDHLLIAELQGAPARIWRRGITPARRMRYRELLGRAGLGEIAAALCRPVKTLSVGLQQILTIFLAAEAHQLREDGLRPDLLLLDEPTSALDMKNTEFCASLLRRLHEEGHTMLIATHHMDFVASLVDRICILGNGVIKQEIDRDQLKMFPTISQADPVPYH